MSNFQQRKLSAKPVPTPARTPLTKRRCESTSDGPSHRGDRACAAAEAALASVSPLPPRSPSSRRCSFGSSSQSSGESLGGMLLLLLESDRLLPLHACGNCSSTPQCLDERQCSFTPCPNETFEATQSSFCENVQPVGSFCNS